MAQVITLWAYGCPSPLGTRTITPTPGGDLRPALRAALADTGADYATAHARPGVQ